MILGGFHFFFSWARGPTYLPTPGPGISVRCPLDGAGPKLSDRPVTHLKPILGSGIVQEEIEERGGNVADTQVSQIGDGFQPFDE